MRLHRLLPLTVAFALIAVPAQAKVVDLPATLGDQLASITGSTDLPVLIPQTLPLDYGGRVYPSVSSRANAWSASFGGAPHCSANACFLASVTGHKGGKPSNPKRVTLTDGKPGYFQPLSCGGSCAPPSLEFKRGGVLYTIQARVAQKGRSDRTILVAAANSAIKKGPR
jgi:hypothetical protein